MFDEITTFSFPTRIVFGRGRGAAIAGVSRKRQESASRSW